MNFAQINGLAMHYRVTGAADLPVVALANSLGTDARIWDGVIAQLAHHYRVISYDKRGHGLSDAPPAPYSLDDHVADLAGLLDHLHVDKLTLCGVSVGGLIAQKFALEHRGRLNGLILCDTAARIGTEEMWNRRIEAVLGSGLGSISEAVLSLWFTKDFGQRFPAARAGWRNMFDRSPAKGYAGTCASLRDADLRAEVGRIDVPTLVIVGAEDRSTPPDLVRQTADLIDGARFEIIEGAGHIPSIEQPEIMAALMLKFMNEVRNG